MTKGQRKQAIKDCLARLQAAEQAYNEACKIVNETDSVMQVGRCWIQTPEYSKAKRQMEQRCEEMWAIRTEYNELTKCKAWRV